MDERRRLHAAKTAQYMRHAQHRASRFALTAAVAAERKHEAAVESQRGSVDATLSIWSTHLCQGRLDPDGITRFAESSASEERSLIAAQGDLDEAVRQRQLANRTASEAKVRAYQATTLLQSLRRKARRKREERALQAMEDKISYDTGGDV
jgi:hypothetical protein